MPGADVLESLAAALAPHLTSQAGRAFGAMGYAQKHDVGTLSPSGLIYSHGPNGMLTYPGVDPVVWSNIMGADSIINQLPAVGSPYVSPTYATITGVRDITGSEQDAVCDVAPVAGLMKSCIVTSVFGRYSRRTQTIDLTRVGKRIDRADPMDLRLMNSPMSVGNPFGGIGNEVDMSFQGLLTNEVSRKMWERNIAIHRLLARQAWTGNPSNNSLNGGYMEMTGLQILVNTGYVDAVGGNTCPSMDSYVRDFAYRRVDQNGTAIVSAITDIWHQLNDRARRADVTPVRWVIAMRSTLFYELSAIWPCVYNTMGCGTASPSSPNTTMATEMVRQRDEMRSGSFLWIDGQRVEVAFDDGIPEANGNANGGNFANGCFSTDIYFLPMSIAGGQSTLYMEYFQYSNPAAEDALGNMVLGRIEGAFITFPSQTRNCVEWQSTIEPRLVLRTPWLAARLQNVVYCPIQHTPEPFPDEPYHVNGGLSTRSTPEYNNIWDRD